MKPAPFRYLRPRSVAEAVAMLAEHGGEAKLIAGGQSLVPMMNFRLVTPAVLIDINGIEGLGGIAATPGGGVRVGARVRHHQLMTSALVAELHPVVPAAMHHVAHLAIRNRGTIGGSLSHADPAAELPMLMLLLEATLRLAGPGGAMREVPAAGFFAGPLSTAIGPEEMLVEIVLPPRLAAGWAFQEYAQRAGDFALAGVGVLLNARDGLAADVRVAVMGVGDTPLRLPEVERVLAGRAVDDALIAEAAAALRAAVTPNEDLHGSPAYRRRLAGGLLARALGEAWARARGLAPDGAAGFAGGVA